MSFIYLASPYSHTSASVRQERFEAVCRAAAKLMLDGQVVFSPIAHSHSIEVLGMSAPMSGSFWKAQDVPMLRHADQLTVLMLDGWRESKGLEWEIETARTLLIPIFYLRPEGTGAPAV